MTELLVSILIPVYNVEKYLSQCLDSVCGQTYRNLQIVIVNDGSTDDSFRICKRYAAADNRIEIYDKANAGVASARNDLLSHIRGEYFLFVDSDDWLEPTMVESLFSIQNCLDFDIVVCDMIKNDESPNLCDSSCVSYTREKIVKAFLEHKWLSGSLCNKLVKTSLLHNERFRSGISYGEDALFFWHLLQHVDCVAVCKLQLYHYRMNNESLSHQNWTPQKKGSGSIVWCTITHETKLWWQQYYDIACARYAIEDFWGLYYASLANYPYDENIKERQINIRKNFRLILKSGFISKNKIFTAFALAYCYPLGRFLKYTRK